MTSKLEKYDLIKDNTNFIAVQSINYTIDSVEEEYNFGTQKQVYYQKNMDELLYKTMNFISEGLFNSVSSRTNEKIKDELEKLYNKSLNENYHKLEVNMDDIENQLKILESYSVIIHNIDKLKEKVILNIIELLEEILYGSKKQLRLKSKNEIALIQEAIENLYKKEYKKIFLDIYIEAIREIARKKELLRKEKNKESWFGCAKILGEINDEDLTEFLFVFSSKCYVEIYSMKKSYEIINQNLKDQLLEILKRGIDDIIKDGNLKAKLEETIKEKTKEQANLLMKEFEKEIKQAFPKYD